MNAKNIFTKFAKPLACVVVVLGLILSFGKVVVKFDGLMGEAEYKLPFKGFDMVKASGFWGILIFALMAAVLVFEYVKPLKNYKKVVGICGGILIAVAIFVGTLTAQNNTLKLVSSNTDAEGAVAVAAIEAAELAGLDIDKHVTFGLGFFVAVIGAVILAGISFVGAENLDNLSSNINLPKMNLPDGSNFAFGASDGQEKKNSSKSLADAEKEMDILYKLADLKKAGILTDEEFAQRKAEILGTSKSSYSSASKNSESDSILQMINKIADLNKQGILTDEEFAERKKGLMDKYLDSLEK